MTSSTATPRTPLRALLRLWPIPVVLCVAGLLAGVKIADHKKATYTAESRLAVGNGDLSGVSLPGFAAAAESLAANYARYLSSAQAIDAVTKTLGPTVAAHIQGISASPFPASNVLRVEVTSDSPTVATAAAGAAAAYLAGVVNGLDPQGIADSVFTQFKNLQDQLSRSQVLQQAAQQRLNLALATPGSSPATITAAETAVRTSTTEVALLSLQSQALSQKYTAEVGKSPAPNGLQIVQTAVITGSDRHSTKQRYALGGVAGGVVLALLFTVGLDRVPARRKNDSSDDEVVDAEAPADTVPPTESPTSIPPATSVELSSSPAPPTPSPVVPSATSTSPFPAEVSLGASPSAYTILPGDGSSPVR